MSDVIEKCTVCGALLDEEDLFCANCGTEAPQGGTRQPAETSQTLKYNFQCSGCGASMSYDASAQTLRCPFCGSEKLEDRPDVKVPALRRVVPLRVDRPAVESLLRQWLGQGFWRPGDLSATAAVTKIAQVYVPYWVFSARTFTYWTADSKQLPAGARGDWCPATGSHHGDYAGLLIGASGVLTPSETSALCPFDMDQAVPPEEVDLDNVIVEQFRVPRKYARPLARESIEALETEACARYVAGGHRNLKVNVRMEGQAGEPVLLPVWIMAYRYRDHLYRFLVNGQTGRAAGQAPFSWTKLAVVLAVAGGILLLVLLALSVLGPR